MVKIRTTMMSPVHESVRELVRYLDETYPIPTHDIQIWLDYDSSRYTLFGTIVTGKVKVSGTTGIIMVAAKGRTSRAVALTTAHEYRHCMQFITDDLSINDSNRAELEQDANTFAEQILEHLWNTQKLHFPSKA